MHWAPICQWGTKISFPLVCSSIPCTVQGPNATNIVINNTDELSAHRHAYANLAKTFNPSKFDPDGMARLAKMAGFRYLVFTAEHCDGFANFKTNVSSYNIMNTPYGKDILGMLFESFRAQDLRVGIYFCPSTWSNDDYWSPDAYTALGKACAPNYNPPSQPDRWQAYLSYLHSQLTVIAQYKPDLVWIDCGQDGTPAVDTMIEKVAPVFRSSNPEVVIQVRGYGDWEDYLELSDHSEAQADNIMGRNYMTAGVHFEVPSTLGKQWSYSPTDTYRSAEDVLLSLIPITAKGGNYLLNLGPGPDGLWPKEGISVFEDLASWMAVNAEAIHDTVPIWPSDYTVTTQFLPKPVQPYRYYTTASVNGSILYVILPQSSIVNSSDSGCVLMPFIRSTNLAKILKTVEVLGVSQPLSYILNETGLYVNFSFPPAQLYSYWSQADNDTAPCATRSCSIYTIDHYSLSGEEGFCYRTPGRANVPFYLIYNTKITDNTLVSNPSNYSGYELVRTECYGYATAGPARVPFDLYWNHDRQDYWTLSSSQSKKQAESLGYEFVRTIGYGDSSSGSTADLKYTFVFKLSFSSP